MKAVEYAMTLVMGAAIVWFVLKPAIGATAASLARSAEFISQF